MKTLIAILLAVLFIPATCLIGILSLMVRHRMTFKKAINDASMFREGLSTAAAIAGACIVVSIIRSFV